MAVLIEILDLDWPWGAVVGRHFKRGRIKHQTNRHCPVAWRLVRQVGVDLELDLLLNKCMYLFYI